METVILTIILRKTTVFKSKIKVNSLFRILPITKFKSTISNEIASIELCTAILELAIKLRGNLAEKLLNGVYNQLSVFS